MKNINIRPHNKTYTKERRLLSKRQADRKKDRQKERKKERQTDRKKDRRTDRKKDRRTDM